MDTPRATAPPTSIILPGSPDHLATIEGRSGVGSASDVSPSTVELADILATPEEKADVANDTNECAAVELPDSIVNLEHTENEADKAEDHGPSDKPESLLCAPEVSAVGPVGEDVALQANQFGTTCDSVKPSTANWAPDLDPPDDRINDASHKFSVLKFRDSPVEPQHNVNEADQVGGFASPIQPAGCHFKAEINESQNKLLTNNSSTDKLDSTGACQEDGAVGLDGRPVVEGRSGAEKGDDSERSSISPIVDHLSTTGTSITGAPHAAPEDKHDISTDEHVFPTATQQISHSFADSPTTLETTYDKAHQAKVDASTATCKDHLSTTSEIGGNGTGDKSNASSSVQPIHGPVTPGPIKKWSSDPGNEFPAGQSADNFVIPEIIEHKKTPNNTNGEPFIVVSANVLAVSESSDMPVDSSDRYSMDRADLDIIEDDEDSRLLAVSPAPLTPSSTISSQVEDFREPEDGLEEGEIREDTVTVFHDAVRFNVKHPLINKWTLWYTRPSGGKPGETWSDLLREIQTFDSVEEFWAIYNNVPPPSTLANKSDYQLFKFGIRPEWEDPANRHGGRFSYMFRERHNIDMQWLDVLLATIGETLEPEGVNEVQGVVANIRKGFIRISCWTRTTGTGWREMDRLVALGRHFKATLGLKNGESLDFSEHDESASTGSARARASFSV